MAKEIKINNGLTLIKTPLLRAEQILQIVQRTPINHIYTRPAKGGGKWDYVTGVYVKKVLNYVFGYMWDFQVVDKGREGKQIWVQGRLTIRDKGGKVMIIKEQFGRADIKFKRESKEILDYGNDLKSASTDALKKCASELGIASDIYGKNEFKDIQRADKGFKIPEKVVEAKAEEVKGDSDKVKELKRLLKGKTDDKKLEDLKKRTGISLLDFNTTEKHAGIIIASLLNAEVK